MGKNQGAGVSNKFGTKVKNKRKAFATVIPAPRKSVKRMVFESLFHFLLRLFSCDSRKKPNQKLSDSPFCTIILAVIKISENALYFYFFSFVA
ncbi:unnamed protein product [Sphenostylis stenocarpa]|uniref:Uncharacterized protein n=1 Tax=Sphenostylis stenocarpa TaxID=92480 RepID=A0AA86THJ9_9FABA|nr:unnamed protein product [Sphenostylis stenocarpa]